VSYFFKLSMVLRSVHTTVTEDYQLPYWVSYVGFAVATILMGGILGLILVCCIDCVCPPRRDDPISRQARQEKKDSDAEEEDDVEELEDESEAEDSQAEDSQDEDLSQDERSQDEDSQDDDSQADEQADFRDESSKPRKRRTRKAD